MKYHYEDLSDGQFETLVVLICQRLLGIGVQPFSTGPDGGRDAKFIGKAELHPSTAAPWEGTTIVQAKHSNGHNKTFSDSDFYSATSSSTHIAKELPRISALKKSQELDHYMLFANRRLSANADNEIRNVISSTCKISVGSIYLCGVEQIELFLKRFKDIPAIADLDPVDSPLIVSPDQLADVVEALARNRTVVAAAIDHPPTPRVPYADKNAINNMTPEYAKVQRSRYLKDAFQIQKFLGEPENTEIRSSYEAAVDEFQLKIIAKRKDYQTFDAVMEYLAELLFARDPVLRQKGNQRLTRSVLFYMYWHCDIGLETDA